MTIEEILANEESQTFDRKSIQIKPTDLSCTVCAFANADGGIIAVGITNTKREVEGVDFEIDKLNEILRTPLDYCIPTVEVTTEMVACKDKAGRDNHVLLIHIEASTSVHANQADEVYMRVGDKSKKLPFEDRTQLMYDKGMRYFEDAPVADAEMDDIDMNFVNEYINKIDYKKSSMEYLVQNRGFIKQKQGKQHVSTAAILLFGKDPQKFFPRARVRFIRYDGVQEKFGTRMNVIKDVIFEGNVLNMIDKAVDFLDTQIKEKTYLGHDGIFVTEEEYPKFVRQEIIVNAVTHRDYSIKGTDIQIKMFDDRIVVETPGRLPGLVKTNNIRRTHFSRNPKIAEFCKAYKYVKEYGEGVDRIYDDMETAGLPEPKFYQQDFMFETVIRNKKVAVQEEKVTIVSKEVTINERKVMIQLLQKRLKEKNTTRIMAESIIKVFENLDNNQVFGRKEVTKILKCSDANAGKIINAMKDADVIEAVKGKGKGKYVYKN